MGSELEPCPISRLHDAFNSIVRRASQGGQWTGTMPFMSIPARPDVDADLIVSSAIDELGALRARVAELESKLAESEDWKNSLANDVIRTSHENMELQAKLAAATKRAGGEQA